MESEAIYKLNLDGPPRPGAFADDDEAFDFDAWDEDDESRKLRNIVRTASGKAARDTRRALKRTTKLLYRSLQKELPALFDRVDDEEVCDEPLDISGGIDGLDLDALDADGIPPAVARRGARRDSLTYLPGWSTEVPLKDGTHVLLRPLMPEDRERVVEGFKRLSSESRYQRFMTSMETLPEAYLRYLTEIDHVHHFAVAAAVEDPARFDLRGLGVARFIELPNIEDEAELAITITDEAQGLGLGVILMDILVKAAAERGFVALRAEVLPANAGMQKLAKKFGGERIEFHDGMVTWRIPITPTTPGLPN